MQHRANPAIVRLSGDQDISKRSDLRLAFQAVRDDPFVIVDVTALRDIDSTAMAEIFRAGTRALSLDGELVIVARSQRTIRLLSIAGLTAHTTIVETIDAARRHLQAPGQLE